MATYIPGVTDYIPQIQPFQPDYNFLGNILQTRQTRYDAAHKQLSSVYGTLLNSPLTRDENIKSRDEFFRTIDTDIKKISGLDLSLKQNQDAAMQVFKPFYENKDIIKDMMWTKNKNNKLAFAENMKYCVDPDKCGGQWWQGGVDYIHYKTDEFRKASKEEAMGFADVDFIPLINVTDKAIKAAKDAGFKVSYDEKSGGYLVHNVNGSKMVQPLTQFFYNKFGSDPNVMRYYQAQAYLNRKQFIMQNAGTMGEQAAEVEYINKLFSTADKSVHDDKIKADKNAETVNAIKDATEQRVKEKGVLPSDKIFINDLQSIIEESKVAQGNVALANKNVEVLNSATRNASNPQYSRESIDQLVANAMLKKELGAAAQAYSDLTSEREIKGADPYSLASFNAKLSLNKEAALLQMREGYKDMAREKDYQYWIKKEQFKHDLKEGAQKGPDAPPTFMKDIPGTSTPVKDEKWLLEHNKALQSQIEGSIDESGSSKSFMNKLVETMKTQYQEKVSDPTKQKLLTATANLIFSGTGIDGAKLVNGDVKEMDKLSRLDPKTFNAVYEKATQTINPNGSSLGKVNDFWTRDFWRNTTTDRSNADLHTQLQQESVKFMEKQSVNVTSALAGKYISDEERGKANIAILLADENKKGFINELSTDYEKQQFAARYAKQYAKDFGGDQVEAYNYALDNVEDVVNDWTTLYKDKAVAFNHLDFFGKRSNALTGGAFKYEFDSAKANNNFTVVKDVVKNALESSGTIFKFGDFTSTGGEDPNAKAIMQEVYNQMMSANSKMKDRPIGSAIISRIGAYDDNYMAMTIQLGEDWASGKRGSKTSPGLTYTPEYREGITMLIPKSQINNQFYKDTEFSPRQWLLDQGKPIRINGNDGKSYVEITKAGNTYQIVSNLPQGWDDVNQNIIYKKVPTSHYSEGYNVDVLVKNYTDVLKGVSDQVDEMIDFQTTTKGIKNVDQLLEAIRNANTGS